MPQMAERLEVDVTAQTLGRYERGERSPDADFLQAMVRLGCDARWLLSAIPSEDERPAPWAHFTHDDELFGRVTEMVAGVYKEIGRSISMVDIGRLASETYRNIAQATEDPAERLMMVKLSASQLRNSLTAARPGSGKRSA